MSEQINLVTPSGMFELPALGGFETPQIPETFSDAVAFRFAHMDVIQTELSALRSMQGSDLGVSGSSSDALMTNVATSYSKELREKLRKERIETELMLLAVGSLSVTSLTRHLLEVHRTKPGQTVLNVGPSKTTSEFHGTFSSLKGDSMQVTKPTVATLVTGRENSITFSPIARIDELDGPVYYQQFVVTPTRKK